MKNYGKMENDALFNSITNHTGDKSNPLDIKDYQSEMVECRNCGEIVIPSDIVNNGCIECEKETK